MDLSGSLQGAGGIGGLIALNDASSGAHFVAFDGNGNLTGLLKPSDSTKSAAYEYSPFGELLRATGPEAAANATRFSTKYEDVETKLLYYGFRSYDPSKARWLSRDPSGEHGGKNLWVAFANSPTDQVDMWGLWSTPVHHDIIENWLTDPKYRNYPWRCCNINVVRAIEDGSDAMDGVFHNGLPGIGVCEAQSSVNSYQHGMRNGAVDQSVQEAQTQYNQFLAHNLVQAVYWASYARQNGRCYLLEWSLDNLGRAYHSFSDSLSPAHAGFQFWWGPYDGSIDWGGFPSWWAFVQDHESKETEQVYAGRKEALRSAVDQKFKSYLDFILKE